MRAPESRFERYMSERILSCPYLMCPSVSGPKALKNTVRDLPCSISGLKKYGVFVQKSLSFKNIWKEKFRRQLFVVYVLIYPLSKFWGNRTNSLWVLAFYSVCFSENLIRENSAKYVNHTGNFYFRPKLKTTISLPIFNLFQRFLIYIRDFIWIITLTEKSKFEEYCRSEGRILHVFLLTCKILPSDRQYSSNFDLLSIWFYLYLVDISSSFPIFFIVI